MKTSWFILALVLVAIALYPTKRVYADEGAVDETAASGANTPKVDNKIVTDSATDASTLEREEQAIKLDGLSVSESKQLREQAEKFEFQAEVNRMMKLIINSLYKNKEIFLRELISNASDALDKIRFMSLTDPNVLGNNKDLTIKIHVDKENKVLHITDTGVGMTKNDLIKNLGTIAKSGTSEFLTQLQEGKAADNSNLIGQFGVGFYSAFLVADTVVVTTKHNDDKQYIWTSDAASFTIAEDPRVDEQLGRGTRISLYLKEEAQDYLETESIKDLIKRYSEFISFDIFLYTSKTVEVEEEEEEEAAEADSGDETTDSDDAEVEIDEEKPEEKSSGKKTVSRTTWDWEIINANKPIWTRNTKDITDDEYNSFFKAFTKESKDPLGRIHFTAEGEVTFRSILYIPAEAPSNFFQEYGSKQPNIKMYVRRVFITDEFDDMMPKYLSFIRGVVDSDDLPLNVSRETLQQHKLLKVIKKKLVRKALEMIKKLEPEEYKKFYKEFGTALKLGLMEDHNNRTRLAKLLRFSSSHSKDEQTSLEDYVARMKKDQTNIFFIAGQDRESLEHSPFVERLLKRGLEVLYMTEPVDEYTVQNLPEFDGKRFQNVAKEGLKFGDETEEETKHFEELGTKFEPLTKWLGDKMSAIVDKAVISTRLSESPCALVAPQYGWDGNMERIMRAQAYAKESDSNTDFYMKQKKTLEINPRHPLVKTLLKRVEQEPEEGSAEEKELVDLATVMVDTARLRSGYTLSDSVDFAARIERMLRLSMGVDLKEEVEAEPEFASASTTEEEEEEEETLDAAAESVDSEKKESGDDTKKAETPAADDAAAKPVEKDEL